MNWTITKRPTKLSDLWGLGGIKTYFETKFKEQEFPKSLLLRGQFGAGKTSVAKIVATMMVCQNPSAKGDPCLQCASCQSVIDEKWDRDVQMIDGGDSGKADLKERIDEFVATGPFYDKRKVMIIEEVQELSQAARNSLLKILESPRDKIHFILLSMDYAKTSGFSSRCVNFNFKAAPSKDIMLYLKSVLEEEGLWTSEEIPKEFKLKGLGTIAQTSAGSYRQALQSLEQALDGKFFTPEAIRDNMGLLDEATTIQRIIQLLDGDAAIWQVLSKEDLYQFYSLSLKILSEAKLYKATGFMPHEDEFFVENTKKVASHINLDMLIDVYRDGLGPVAKPYLRDADYILHILKFIEKVSPPAGISRITESGSPTTPAAPAAPIRTRVPKNPEAARTGLREDDIPF